MNPLDALRRADPAERLGPLELDDRDERLLREILSSERVEPGGAPRDAPSRARRTRSTRDRRPMVVTAIVAVVVTVAAVVAIRSVPGAVSGPVVAASPTSSAVALEDAVFAKLSEVATGDVPVREKSALTWTEKSPSPDGGGIDTTGRTLYIAAACAGGGSIAIRETGRADVTLTCSGFTVTGPIDLTPTGKTGGTAALNVVTTSGHPRYIAKAMAFVAAATPAGVHTCSATSVTLTATGLEGALGTDYGFIDITNHGASPCTLRGWPTAFLTDRPGGERIGAPVGRTGPTNASTVGAVTLQPDGGRASLRVGIANIGGYANGDGTYLKACGHPIPANGWEITLPGSTTRLSVPLVAPPHLLCSSTTTGIAFISQVVPFTRTQ